MTDLALDHADHGCPTPTGRDLSPVELTRHLLDRITRLDPRFHSYVTVLTSRPWRKPERRKRTLSVVAIADRCMGYRWQSRICVAPQDSHDLWRPDVQHLAT